MTVHDKLNRSAAPDRRRAQLYDACALAVFALLLALYIRTLLPGAVGGDAGELQYAGPLLALVHPTGQPLYVLLAKLWTTLVPAGSAAYEMNLLAAFSTAAGCAALAGLLLRVHHNMAIAVTAGLALGLGATVWGQAVIADKYGFNVLLAALICGLALWWDRQHYGPTGDRLLYALALAFGIGLLHHRSLALFAPGLALLAAYRLRRDLWRRPKRTLICAGLAVMPALLVYPTVLPWLQARQLSPLLWQPGTPREWLDFLMERHVLSGEALVFDAGIGGQLEIYARTALADYTVLAALAAALGFAAALRRSPGAGVFLAITFVLQAALAANFRGNERQFTYYLPSFVALMAAFAEGLAALWRLAKQAWLSRGAAGSRAYRVFVITAGAALFALPLYQFAATYPQRLNDARYGEPLDLWRQTLKTGDMGARLAAGMNELPENAVLAADWEQVTILWYMQQVEGVRPDLSIFYPIERYADFTDGSRPVCLARHLPVAEQWHPFSVGALICLGRGPQFNLPDGLIPVGAALVNPDGEHVLELAGYMPIGSRYPAGTHVPLLLVWRALAAPDADYSVSLQLLDANAAVVWQRDIQSPVLGMYATSRWSAGEIVTDYHELSLPRDLPPGAYRWAAVVYRVLPDGAFEHLRDGQGSIYVLGSTVEVR